MSTRRKIINLFVFLMLFTAFVSGMGRIPDAAAANLETFSTEKAISPWKLNSQTKYGNRISMLSKNNGWMMSFSGASANLYHWDGTTWISAGTLTHTQEISQGDIAMISPMDGWIVLGGVIGVADPTTSIYRWNGSAWNLYEVLTRDVIGVSFYRLDVLSVNNIWATTGSRVSSSLYQWNGSVWVWRADFFMENVSYDLDMLSSSDGWTMGYKGKIAHWNGASWITAASPVTANLNAVDMISATDGWMVGNSGTILRWDGVTWNTFFCPVSTNLNAVDMISATDGWIVGAQGTILRWNGTSWTNVTGPVTRRLDIIAMVSAADGWITGDRATLRYQPATLNLNYSNGQPGSYFNVSGTDFPPDSPLILKVNGQDMALELETDSVGNFSFSLNTTGANSGMYYLTVAVDAAATASFVLSPDDPLRERVGTLPVVDIPDGIGCDTVFLPFTVRQ